MISPATKWCEMPSTRKVHQRLSTWGFTQRVMILSKYQDSSQPEGKQALSINHTVCSNSLGAVSDTYQIPKILAKGQPFKQAFFFFWLCGKSCRILFPRPGIEATPAALEVRS